MTTAPALHLTHRTGLPPDMAYLLPDFPKPSWTAHVNYGELAAFWLHVHEHLRGSGGQLQQVLAQGVVEEDAAAFQRAFVPRFNAFLQHLTQHHQIEDVAYFPKFRRLDPRMVAGFDLLESDHHVIHDALEASLASARNLIAALPGGGDPTRFALDAHRDASDTLLDLLHRHLADEEDLVLPAMLRYGERAVG